MFTNRLKPSVWMPCVFVLSLVLVGQPASAGSDIDIDSTSEAGDVVTIRGTGFPSMPCVIVDGAAVLAGDITIVTAGTEVDVDISLLARRREPCEHTSTTLRRAIELRKEGPS